MTPIEQVRAGLQNAPCALPCHESAPCERCVALAALRVVEADVAALDAQEREVSARRPTPEQQVAIALAIFDNDYAEMNRLKAEGKWITPRSAEAPVAQEEEISESDYEDGEPCGVCEKSVLECKCDRIRAPRRQARGYPMSTPTPPVPSPSCSRPFYSGVDSARGADETRFWWTTTPKQLGITDTQACALASLLGQYQDMLEEAITCELIPSEDGKWEGPADPEIHRRVKRDRRRWRACEDFQRLLSARREGSDA